MCDGNKRRLCTDVQCQDCLNKSFTSHVRSVRWSARNALTPRQVFKSSNTKYWFDCDKCHHDFETSPNMINNNSWCPYCAIPSRKLCYNDDCAECFDRSFQSHEKSNYWSVKNNTIPRRILRGSGAKYWFDCDKCEHDFETSPNSVSNNTWCPYCAIPSRILCSDDDCDECFNRSFLSNERAGYWSTKNNLTPREIIKGSQNKYWFDCDKCNHDFETSPEKIISENNWCPYCSGNRLCSNNDCTYCFNRSFASVNRICWSKKNNIESRQVFKYSNNKYWFECNNCKCEFESTAGSITYGSGCPKCKNKSEAKLFDKLTSSGYALTSQFCADWCKNSETDSYLPFDFLMEEYKLIIELDGRQHFEQVSNWQSPEITRQRDLYKMDCANSQGYTVIRILQEDVWNDRNDWFEKLELELYERDKPTRVYIASGNQYVNY